MNERAEFRRELREAVKNLGQNILPQAGGNTGLQLRAYEHTLCFELEIHLRKYKTCNFSKILPKSSTTTGILLSRVEVSL